MADGVYEPIPFPSWSYSPTQPATIVNSAVEFWALPGSVWSYSPLVGSNALLVAQDAGESESPATDSVTFPGQPIPPVVDPKGHALP